MKDKILELLNAYKSEVDNFNDAIFTDKFDSLSNDIVKLCCLSDIKMRTFRFSGISEGEKFIKHITSTDSESAIADFETTYPYLTWRFKTDIT